jgi:hypothetical protein
MTPLEEFLSDLFHSCALRAYVDVMQETGQDPPDSETTRKRAYSYYEAERCLTTSK